jgi:hypothetical protein
MKIILTTLAFAAIAFTLAIAACITTGSDDDDNNDNDDAAQITCTDGTCCWTDCSDGSEICGATESEVCDLPDWVAEVGCIIDTEYEDEYYHEVSLKCPCFSSDRSLITTQNYYVGPECINVAEENPIDCDIDFSQVCADSSDDGDGDDDDVTDDDDDNNDEATWEVCEEGTYQCSISRWDIQQCENDEWVDIFDCTNYEGRHGDNCHCGHTGDNYYCNFGEEICYDFSE